MSPHRSVHSKRLRSHSSADRESIGFSSESEIAYEDVLEQFRRVHIVSRAHTLQVKPKFKLPASDMTIVSLRLPFPIRCWTCGWSNIIPSGTVWNDLIKKPTGIFDGKTRSIIRNRHDCGQWIELETIEHPFKTSFNVIAGGVAVFGLEYDRAHSKEVNTFKSAHERSQSSSELFQGEIDDDSSGYRVFPGSTWRDNVSVTGQLKNYPTFFAKPKPSENIPTPASPRNSSPLSAVPVRVSSGPNPIADMAPNVEQPLASFKHGLISPQVSYPFS